MTTQPVPSLQLGKYRLIIELAQGGMGNVYLAVAQGPAGFNKLSVIKELKPSLLEEQGFLEMFLDEARLSARLSHQNVVQTNEASVEGGRAFIAMEYLDGQSLVRVRSRLGKKQKLPLGTHLRVVAEACRGLEYAHDLCDFDGTPLGVVHRDVSPHNVFVTYDGQVKIVDFGVAKALSSNHETTVGVMKGKVPYMAPEQVMGTEMDRRVDVFALGVILWEAVANRRLWDQQRTETILAKLMSNAIPRLASVVPNAPPRLLALVDRATAADANERFPSAEALRVEIEGYLAETGEGAHHTLRELGAAMAEGFAYERAQVSAAVTEQLRLLRQSPEAASGIGIVRLPNPPATGSQPSGSSGSTNSTGPRSGGHTANLQISDAYPQLSRPGISEPPPGGDQSGSGSVSQRYGRPPEASTSMAHASGPRFSAAPQPASSSARPLAIVAALLLLAVAAIGAVVLVSRNKSANASTAPASSGTDPSVVGIPPAAPDPNPPTAAPVITSTLAGTAVPQGDGDAAPITGRGRTPPPPVVIRPPTGVRPPPPVVVPDPPPTATAKVTKPEKPDLGY